MNGFIYLYNNILMYIDDAVPRLLRWRGDAECVERACRARGARRVRDVRVERVVRVEHVPLSESDGPYIIAVSHHSNTPGSRSSPLADAETGAEILE